MTPIPLGVCVNRQLQIKKNIQPIYAFVSIIEDGRYRPFFISIAKITLIFLTRSRGNNTKVWNFWSAGSLFLCRILWEVCVTQRAGAKQEIVTCAQAMRNAGEGAL